jgi:hypothetical protein
MYIPDEWEPADWDEAGQKECRRFRVAKIHGRCPVPMGASSERGAALHVPDMPCKLDGIDRGTAEALREPEVSACVVVQSPGEEEAENSTEPRSRSFANGFSTPLPQASQADEKDAGCFL